jgi:hypothetical protein
MPHLQGKEFRQVFECLRFGFLISWRNKTFD